MGESPESVFVTGCPSYDRLFAMKQSRLEENQTFSFLSPCPFELRSKSFLLVLMHPITNNTEESSTVYDTLLLALFTLRLPTVMFYPNIDPGNKTLIQILHEHQKADGNSSDWLRLVTHVSPENFVVLMMHASAMLGNSSAGIRETCVCGTPALNLGTRQDGRETPQNVTTLVSPTKQAIMNWCQSVSGKHFPTSMMYGRPDSARTIAGILRNLDVDGKLKTFWEPRYSLLPPPPPTACLETKFEHKPLKVLALITARGGSKGIQGKNIADLNGKPLLQYTVEAALGAKFVDRVIISTDSHDIARIARGCGCEVPFMRPAHLARDDSSHLSCIVHALDVMRDQEDYEPDCILLLQPTSPLRTSEDIDSAVNIMKQTACDLVVSVCEHALNLSKFSYVGENGQISPYAEITTDEAYVRRQSLTNTYSENGAIFLQRTATLRSPPEHLPNAGSLKSEDVKGYVMPKCRSLDIDSPFDLHLAKLLLKDPFTKM